MIAFIILAFYGICVSSFEVVGYLPEYRYGTIQDWDGVMKRLTQLILFSLEVRNDGELKDLDRFPSPELLETILAAAVVHKTKVILCLGGNARSGGFPTVSLSSIIRTHFIQHILDFLLKHKLHGLDLNWEYPSSKQEWDGLFKIIEGLKTAFKPHGLILTMAIYPGQEKLLPGKTIANLDFIHTMVYDQRDRHSTMEFAKTSIKNIKSSLSRADVKSKVTLGVPFYGRLRKNGEAVTYQELINNNPTEQVATKNEVNGYYYNGVKTISAKTRLASKENMAGVMIWEVGQDITDPESPLSLLNAIYRSRPDAQPKTDL